MNNTARATLNIGHNIPARFAEEGEKLTLDSFTVLAALKQLGIQVIESACHQSATEDTTVAAIAVPLSPRQGHLLAELLCQDAIVQFVHGSVEASALYGPKASEWGEFNTELFVTLAGGRLATEPVYVSAKRTGEGGLITSYILTVKSGPSAGHRLAVASPSERELLGERLTELTGAELGKFKIFETH